MNDTAYALDEQDSAATPEIEHIRRHIYSTYFALRLGMGAIAFAFPLILWGGGLATESGLLGSMSEYYHSAMRDWFVGLLFAVGAFLYLYKGFSDRENIALNLAGLFAFAVALVPTGTSWLHGAAALAMFACMVFVALATHGDTVQYILDRERAALYRRTYKTLGALMFVLPIVAAILIAALQWHNDLEKKSFVFAVELGAIWAFSAYWLVKGREIWVTQKKAAAEPEARPMRKSEAAPAARYLA